MDVQRLLSSMALEIHSSESPDAALQHIAEHARVAVDAADAGILLVKARGRVETPFSTSGLVAEAHQLQAQLDEGPCLDSIRGDVSSYLSEDVANDARWPEWGRRAAALGYHSVVSARLETNDRRYGSLNAYARERDSFSHHDVEVIELLAVHASVALATSLRHDELQSALDTRNLIGQAQGILMAVYDLDGEGAFQYLRRLSMSTNTRLLTVAADIVSQRHELRKNID